MTDIMVVAALPQELGDAFDDVPVVYTGVGKVNAAHALTKAVVTRRPKLVVNFGTAACEDKTLLGLCVYANMFHQYDMDCSALGLIDHETPFEDVPHPLNTSLYYRNFIYNMVKLCRPCHTADKFVTKEEFCTFAMHDMEAYALAKVCFYEKLPFVCVKYISDAGSADEWKQNCSKAAPMFREIYDRLVGSCA